MPGPAVSVLMPVYNAERFVGETVQSILDQTFGDFEFNIVNDGSTDGTLDVLESYARQDDRIRLVSRENRGYIASVNEVLDMARAPLLARIDGDDTAMPERFEKQVAFLEANPDVVAVGSAATIIDEDGEVMGAFDVPLTHEQIEAQHLSGNSSIHHPSVMMRHEAVRAAGPYRDEYHGCDDYDLWLRLGEQGRLANLPDRLLIKRQLMTGVVCTMYEGQSERIGRLLHEVWDRRDLEGDPPHIEYAFQGPADIYRQWGWMALKNRNRRTARKYARKAVTTEPSSIDSWRLACCAIRGH